MTKFDKIAFDAVTNNNIREWLEGDYEKETKECIRKLLEQNPREALDAFYTHLSFGTGGLRGIVGVGTNRINKYTIRAATQGLANYLSKQPKSINNEKTRVIIGYDTRIHSRAFAEESAKVLAANDIEVLLFDEFRPTPLVSFGCRIKQCSAAIMITASHNPAAYNGYKVYWSDGGQVLPPHDKGIIDEVGSIRNLAMIKMTEDLNHPNIIRIADEIDKAYYQVIFDLQHYAASNRQKGALLKIVYSSIHGTGITMVPETLRSWGFTNVSLVEAQKDPDGNFPTVKSPNPEEPETLQMGMTQLLQTGSDIFLATDPDADRVAAVVHHLGEARILTGNQIACLCLEHICAALTKEGRMPENAAFVKSVVTSELFKIIAQSYHKPCFEVLTGFKYIAQLIKNWEDAGDYAFVFGAEESFGYLLGTQSRDKDGVLACALLAEAALQAKLQNKTLIDLLHEIYSKYGVFEESVFSLHFPESKEGHEQMDRGMKKLFKRPPKAICGLEVIAISNYTRSETVHTLSGTITPILLPKNQLISLVLSDESVIHIRPSGTEPKIKIYCGVKKNKGIASVEETMAICHTHCTSLIKEVANFLQ